MGNSAGAEPPAEQQYIALAVPSRRRLVEALRSAGRPMDIGELATVVGLHVTTTRFHLHVLERAGLVSRTPQPPTGPGRPRQLYTSVPQPVTTDGHRQLAELLAAALAADGEEGRRRAEEVGRGWAEQQVPARRGLSWEEAAEDIAQLFARLGFAPRAVDLGEAGCHVPLTSCPFRDVARVHPEVVCSLHLGLLRGALTRVGMDAVAGTATLRPFVAPELCIADIQRPPVTAAGADHPGDGR